MSCEVRLFGVLSVIYILWESGRFQRRVKGTCPWNDTCYTKFVPCLVRSKGRIMSVFVRKTTERRTVSFLAFLFSWTSSTHWRWYLITSSQFKNSHMLHLQSSEYRTSVNVSSNGMIAGLTDQVTMELLQRWQHKVEGKCCYHRKKYNLDTFFQ